MICLKPKEQTDEEPKISVVILNYNGLRFLEPCLKSVLNSTYRNFEIIVVDNGSKDGSVGYLRKSFSDHPKVKPVLLNKNYGFAMGNNIGYKYTNPCSEFIFFLNNDTEMEEDCLEKIVKRMEQDPSIGAAQPKIRYMHDKSRINNMGGTLDHFGRSFHLGRQEIDRGQYDSIKEIFFAQGAAIVVRRDVIEKIGLFDPSFFIYYEETDLCWRIRLAGYKIILIPNAVVYHWGGATVDSRKIIDVATNINLKVFHGRKNQLAVMLKNYSYLNVVKYVLPFSFRIFIVGLACIFQGKEIEALAYLRALLWIFTNSRQIIQKRQYVQKVIRRVPDSEVMRLMIS